ncbi:MAG: Crp/Fnr family transcriptional regulator [Acidobacteriota bacterium]
MNPERLALLSASPLFRHIAADEIGEIAGQGREARIRSRAILFREGEPAAALHLVLEGRVTLKQGAAGGQEVMVRLAGPGEILAAVAALAESSYPATARAVEPALVLLWPRDLLHDLLLRHPELAVNAIGILAARIRELQERFLELATERVAQRIARALVRLARQTGRRVPDGVLIDVRLSRQDLAEMTGTTLFTVSRTLSEWQGLGIVRSRGGRIVVASPHALVAIAEGLDEERPRSRSPRS